MKRLHKYLLSLLSGLLLSAAWPARGFAPLLLVAFVPILLVEADHWKQRAGNHYWGIFKYAALAFGVWNLLTTYWIYNATLVGIVAAMIVNTLLMASAFVLFHYVHRRIPLHSAAYLSLIGFWISMDFLTLRWDLNWPWLNLGNGLAAYPSWIQWYEYTGIFGGSLWILGSNLFLLLIVSRYRQPGAIKSTRASYLLLATWIVVPLSFSLWRYHTYTEKPDPVDIIVVQPNLDPYSEQYELNPRDVAAHMLGQAEGKMDSTAQLVVFPESALQEYLFEDQFGNSPSLSLVRGFLARWPSAAVLAGISTRKLYAHGEEHSPSARRFSDVDEYYEAYNTALLLKSNGEVLKYHKSKLTPGVELMPLVRYFKFIEKLALNLGGTIGSLGMDGQRAAFPLNDSVKVSPVICYESTFGEFVTGFVSQGAGILCIITNDGWWGDTPGHRQHNLFASLRAIETRRSIARSANTGTSCFVNQRGDIMQPTAYWQEASIRQRLNANHSLTWYVRFGDYIGRLSLLISALMLFWAWTPGRYRFMHPLLSKT